MMIEKRDLELCGESEDEKLVAADATLHNKGTMRAMQMS